MTFFKNFTITLNNTKNQFSIKTSHHPKSVSIQSYNISGIDTNIISSLLLMLKPINTLYDPIKINHVDSNDYTIIINSLPSGQFPHNYYGIIFSDPCIAPNTFTSRVCSRYLHNEYYLDFKLQLINLESKIPINYDTITLQLLIETY